MRFNFRKTAAAMLTALLLFVPLHLGAQATVNQTTLSTALNATTRTVVLASASTVAAGQLLFIDREAILIVSLVSTTAQVQRGIAGTVAASHISGAPVYSGTFDKFYSNDPSGSCTSTSEVALPHINTVTGNVFDCKGGEWVRYTDGGLPAFSTGRIGNGPTATAYTTAGAITVMPGVQFIGSAGALAMTLVNPTVAQNGMIMVLEASTAQAHTVTYTAGFNGGTTARDVATYGGAIGDNMVIVAVNGTWWVISTRNVTLG